MKEFSDVMRLVENFSRGLAKELKEVSAEVEARLDELGRLETEVRRSGSDGEKTLSGVRASANGVVKTFNNLKETFQKFEEGLSQGDDMHPDETPEVPPGVEIPDMAQAPSWAVSKPCLEVAGRPPAWLRQAMGHSMDQRRVNEVENPVKTSTPEDSDS